MIFAFLAGFTIGGVGGVLVTCIAVMANDKEGR